MNIFEAYKKMKTKNNTEYEDRSYSYADFGDGKGRTNFVNRPPTEDEKKASDALGDVYKKTMTQPMDEYLKTITGRSGDIAMNALKAQNDGSEDAIKSKSDSKEYIKNNSFK